MGNSEGTFTYLVWCSEQYCLSNIWAKSTAKGTNSMFQVAGVGQRGLVPRAHPDKEGEDVRLETNQDHFHLPRLARWIVVWCYIWILSTGTSPNPHPGELTHEIA